MPKIDVVRPLAEESEHKLKQPHALELYGTPIIHWKYRMKKKSPTIYVTIYHASHIFLQFFWGGRCQKYFCLFKFKCPPEFLRLLLKRGSSNMTDFHKESPTFMDGSIAPSEGARADMTRTPGTCAARFHPPGPPLGVEVPTKQSSPNKNGGWKNGKETVF